MNVTMSHFNAQNFGRKFHRCLPAALISRLKFHRDESEGRMICGEVILCEPRRMNLSGKPHGRKKLEQLAQGQFTPFTGSAPSGKKQTEELGIIACQPELMTTYFFASRSINIHCLACSPSVSWFILDRSCISFVECSYIQRLFFHVGHVET